MPRAYPMEFRRRTIALVYAGNTVAQTTADLGVTETAIDLSVVLEPIADEPRLTRR